jgi:hypothetical protein
MSWTRYAGAFALIPLLSCSNGAPSESTQAGQSSQSTQSNPSNPCLAKAGTTLRFVDVFDGPPESLATLVPDEAGERSGYWNLKYVYDAGRSVTIRCKYANDEMHDVKLSTVTTRCDYTIDAQQALTLRCK